jgi:homoserine kinase
MKILVPATTTNFGSGFDTFGLALEIHNEFDVEPSESFRVEAVGRARGIPRDESNLVIQVYKRCCEILGENPKPFFLRQKVDIPPARGLGSSATAILAGIEIFCSLHRRKLSEVEKLEIAFEFENHPDNLAPALKGGFVICSEKTYHSVDFPEDLSLLFFVPDYEISTSEARRVLPRAVSLEDAVFNLQRASLFLAGLLLGRYELLREGVEDRLHQPYRAGLIKEFESFKESAYQQGALAVFISGSGPALCALTIKGKAAGIREEWEKLARKNKIKGEVLETSASKEGLRVI